MNKVVGIKFRGQGKEYDFYSGNFVLKKDDMVMVITEEGPAVGYVSRGPEKRGARNPDRPLKKVFRKATPAEVKKYNKNCELEKSIFIYCCKKINKKIPMQLVSVKRRFDGGKVVVYFTADGRIDFRELVKDLVRKYRTRIEMKQIGVRHQAKMVGGLGSCGRGLCCSSFLSSFSPVTIKMAKEQNISLNPAKISGMCGRLMCCLSYEHGYYEKIRKTMPKIGKMVITSDGEGKVIRQNMLKETLTVLLDAENIVEVPLRNIIRNSSSKKSKKTATGVTTNNIV